MSFSEKLKANKFNPLIMLFYGLIVGTAGYIIIASRAAPAPPTIYLNPAAQTYGINTTFTVDVRENSGTTGVNTIQASFSYPASIVDFVSADCTNSAFGTAVQCSGGAGVVNIIRGVTVTPPNPTVPLTGDQFVGTITFKTKTISGAAAMAFTSGTALVSASSNQDILVSLAATGSATFTVDATPPTVSMTAPVTGAVLAGGGTNTISVTATDNTSISGVDILIDGVVKTTLTTPPYNYSWNTTGLALGAHTVQVRANDPYGNTASTAIATITLTDQTAPTVSITSPTAGSTATGTITVAATAADNAGGTGLNKVEFYVDGALKATDTTSPYSFSWDSKTATDGSHSLTAKAYDNATPANLTTSAAVAVTVDNADHIPPSTPGSFISTGHTLTSISLSWTASTDNIGVTGYQIKRNGTVVTTVPSPGLTYTDSGLTSGTSFTYTVAAVDANNNFSTPATVTASTIPVVAGDINADGHVTIIDLSLLLTNFGTNNAASDLNHNGSVDVFDLSILLSNFGA